MIYFFKNLKSYKLNRGMTYVELIVVLSIFALMTSIIIFDYGKFQDNVDIKILANDIALKIVEAQKSAIAGKWNANVTSLDWKPSYGVYFDYLSKAEGNDKTFIYFNDVNADKFYSDLDFCSIIIGSDIECLEKIDITKGNYILKIEDNNNNTISDPLAITFTRPDSSAFFYTKDTEGTITPLNVSYIKITISSPLNILTSIRVESSGRIQIN